MSLNFRLFNKQVVPKFKKKIYKYIYIYIIFMNKLVNNMAQ